MGIPSMDLYRSWPLDDVSPEARLRAVYSPRLERVDLVLRCPIRADNGALHSTESVSSTYDGVGFQSMPTMRYPPDGSDREIVCRGAVEAAVRMNAKILSWPDIGYGTPEHTLRVFQSVIDNPVWDDIVKEAVAGYRAAVIMAH